MSPFLDPSELLANAMLGCLLKGAIEDLQNEGWQPEKPKIETTEKVLYLTDSKSGKLPVWQKNRSTENFYRSSELHQEKSVLARQTQTVELDFSSRTASDQRLFLQRDPLGYVDGMGLYTYVGNNPINMYDPFGLAERARHGYKPTGTGHHIVPTELWDSYNFSEEAMKIFDKATVEAKGHDYSKHGRVTGYSGHVEAELRTHLSKYMAENGIKDGMMTIAQQEEFANVFVDNIKSSRNPYINGFNNAVESKSSLLKWHKLEGRFLPKPPTGMKNNVADYAIRGISKIPMASAVKIARKVPGAKYFVNAGIYSVIYNNARADGHSPLASSGIAGFDTINPMPMGISDSDLKWSASRDEMRATDKGFGAMFNTLNPFSARWIGHRVLGSIFGYGPEANRGSTNPMGETKAVRQGKP